ncbi:MAG: PDZ domain-containing protein [Limisphaerales bacterium]
MFGGRGVEDEEEHEGAARLDPPAIGSTLVGVFSKALLLAAACLAVLPLNAGDPERSVIQIITFSQSPVWDAPWRFTPVGRSGGSGFVIKGRRIMTNAHVVAWAKQILVRRFQDPRPYEARVAFVGHDCDLAVLEVDDPAFFSGIEPLEFGELPDVRSTVITYGYPAGGEQISYTRGVVSRIEVQNYVHPGNRSLLAVQTDAAINPGNSGGPVIQDDKVVGVAFQGVPGLENAGFFIPPQVVGHFLTDIGDGKHDGFPLAGLRLVSLENPAFRRFLGLEDDGVGARIDSLVAGAAAAGVLKPDDVLLDVAGFAVGSDGNILYRGNRVAAGVAFQEAQNGETVPLKILRERRPLDLDLKMTTYDGDRLAGNQHDVPPRYFVFAGLVFTTLSNDFLRTFGRDWNSPANASLVHELFYLRHEQPKEARPEPVVLVNALAHPVNADLSVRGRVLVDKINGVRIERLEDVIRAFEGATGPQHLIEYAGRGGFDGLDRAAATAANAAILQTYGIPSDRRL